MRLTDVRRAMAYGEPVTYKGASYTVAECIMQLRGGEWVYSLVLRDAKAKNSYVRALLEDVVYEVEIQTVDKTAV